MGREEKILREWLLASMRPTAECTAEELVVSYGRAFEGVKLPRGYRRMAAKQCFGNSFKLTIAELGDYCEGFAMQPDSMPFHHAWVSIDGLKAVDVTLQNPDEHFYLGVQFSTASLLRLTDAGFGHWGFLRPPLDKNALIELITSDLSRKLTPYSGTAI